MLNKKTSDSDNINFINIYLHENMKILFIKEKYPRFYNTNLTETYCAKF